MKTLLKVTSQIKIGILSIIILYGIFYSCNKPESSSTKVWCPTHNRWEDRQTLNSETQLPVWCPNCKTYHAPNEDE